MKPVIMTAIRRGITLAVAGVIPRLKAGYYDGYQAGYNAGYSEGYQAGYYAGYNDGYQAGYYAGYNDGYQAGGQGSCGSQGACGGQVPQGCTCVPVSCGEC